MFTRLIGEISARVDGSSNVFNFFQCVLFRTAVDVSTTV